MVLRSTSQRKAPTKVGAIYARYSSRFQHSIEDQVRVCKDWAEKNGIMVPDDLIFVDRAITGKSCRRQGLKDFQKALAENRAHVAIMFTTNRLYRKFYQSLAFVEEEICDRGKRAVFVKSGPIDTDDKEHWRKLLHIHALIDEFVIQTIAAHVQSAHEGLLLQTRVFGTVTFGFTGEPIPGQTTRLGKPAKRLVIDGVAAEWVKKVYRWFLVEHASIREIVRRLNAEKAPLPPRSQAKRWTRVAVRRLLSNPRYRGWWEYGRTQAVWVNKPGYSKHVEREEPLAGVQVESLRIIDDATWYAAQERLGKVSRNAGRTPVDGDRRSRPRVLNDLIYCGKHNTSLYVHGPNGKYMVCPACRDEPEPELYSLLHRRLTLDLISDELAKLIPADESLVDDVIGASMEHLQTLTQPDPAQAASLKHDIERLTRQIDFVLETPVETEQDRDENRARVGKLRAERAGRQKVLAEVEEAVRNPQRVPTRDEIQSQLNDIRSVLREAACSDDPAELAALHDIIAEATGGKIIVTQQGKRDRHKGWLRVSFDVNVLDVVARRFGIPQTTSDGVHVEIDIKKANWRDEMCEKVMILYRKDLLGKEIGEKLGLHRSQVTMLLQHWATKHGQELPNGHKRRAALLRKQTKTPKYQELADPAKALWDLPENLAVLEIGRRLRTNDTIVWKAIAFWHRVRGLPVPTAKDRRMRTMQRARQLYEEDVEIKDIAATLGYTPRGIKLLLKESFALTGEKMPDGRSRRHKCKKVG